VDAPETPQTAEGLPQRFVTSPHNRPRCPVHGERLHVRSSVGRVAYLRCPVNGCDHVDKMAREVLQDQP
jgi:hypothetical protein